MSRNHIHAVATLFPVESIDGLNGPNVSDGFLEPKQRFREAVVARFDFDHQDRFIVDDRQEIDLVLFLVP